MERLTHVMTVRMDGNDDFVVMKEDLNKAFNKLGRLERIEQELGIPLEVLFKALKDGVYYDDGDDVDFSYTSLFNDEDDCEWYFTTDSATFVELKDYGKTWALTREELE